MPESNGRRQVSVDCTIVELPLTHHIADESRTSGVTFSAGGSLVFRLLRSLGILADLVCILTDHDVEFGK